MHIVPFSNEEYWRSLDRHSNRLDGESVGEVWQRMLRDSHRDRYLCRDSERFTDSARQLTSPEYRARYGHR